MDILEIPEILSRYTIEQLDWELSARHRGEKFVSDPRLDTIESHVIASYLAVAAGHGGIIGTDDRVEWHQFGAPEHYRQGQSVVIIIRRDQIERSDQGWGFEDKLTFREAKGVCCQERFSAQYVFQSQGTGVLVGPDIIATACHVALGLTLSETYFVFGFAITHQNSPSALAGVRDEDVYRAVGLIAKGQQDSDDWALLRIRPYDSSQEPVHDWGNRVVRVSRDPNFAVGVPVHMIGHPCGLPMKLAGGAEVFTNDPNQLWFTATLDAYVQNSGSPVFRTNAPTANDGIPVLEGIATQNQIPWSRLPDVPIQTATWRPDFKFETNDQCWISNQILEPISVYTTRCIKASRFADAVSSAGGFA